MLRPHFFLGVTVPAAFLALVGQPLIEHSVEAVARPAVEQAALKSDRLAPVRPAAKAQVPVAVEITGLGAAKVTLRNAAGDVVYQTDATRNTTLVARDTAIPHVTVRERTGTPVAQRDPAPPARRCGGCRRAARARSAVSPATRPAACCRAAASPMPATSCRRPVPISVATL